MIKKIYNSDLLGEQILKINSIQKDYIAGFSIEQLVQMYGITYHTVRKILIDNDVPIRAKNNKISK